MTAGNWAVVHHLGWDEVPSGTCGGATYGDEKTRRVNGGNRQTFHWGLVTKNMVWWTMIIPSPQRTHPIFVGKVNDGVSPKFGQSPTCFLQSSDSYYWWTPHLLLGCPFFYGFQNLGVKTTHFLGPDFVLWGWEYAENDWSSSMSDCAGCLLAEVCPWLAGKSHIVPWFSQQQKRFRDVPAMIPKG